MPSLLTTSVRLAFALSAALALGACANTGNTDASALGAGGAATPGSQQDFVVNVGDRVLFEEDHSDLTPEAEGILAKQAQWLRQYPRYTFTVEGHADERGTREYNIALGARRAQTVHDYLVAQGLPSQRMRTISYGKERPVATCEEESCYRQNRRSVTVLNGAAGS